MESATHLQPLLGGIRIVSLALNLPGPAALLRCRQLGARCIKFEPPSGDPMAHYSALAYAALHEGVEVRTADLKQAGGREALHAELTQADVLLTSFRPSALRKLGLDEVALRARHRRLSLVAIVGAPGPQAEEPGHDLTYLAASGLVPGLDLPPTLYADMGGALLATEAVLKAVLHMRTPGASGIHIEVPLQAAAEWLALPRDWGLTTPGAAVGGGHAGYRVYACADGRVAVAALEPHFAQRLCGVAGLDGADMQAAATGVQLGAWLRTRSRAEIDAIAEAQDLPLFTLEPVEGGAA